MNFDSISGPITQTSILPKNLQESQMEIEKRATEAGLTFPEVQFIMLNFSEMNQVAAYGGFPQRYPHWKFGMEYERLRKSYAWGLHRIYEMVINTDPCYAYLLVSNLDVDQHLVMAHVYGHADFFLNNMWFAHTNRQMLDQMANHGTRIRRYMDRFGLDVVEEFLDRALSLENLIDMHAPSLRRAESRTQPDDIDDAQDVGRLPNSRDYMDSYINPPEYLQALQEEAEEAKAQEKNFPQNPQKDVLKFLMEYAPLEPWQQDIIGIIREEMLYFIPQGQTKIMNEGWAVYWHSHIMTKYILRDHEAIDYADHHSGTLATSPGQINPYKLGVELFKDIEDRWDRGAFGPEYEACDDQRERANWDKKLGLGREKIFEVRKIYNDIGFIDTFLTREFAEKQEMFRYRFNPRTRQYEIDSRDFDDIKQQLLFSLTNFGEPYITLEDANYRNRGELYLRHRWEGVDLREDYAHDTLQNLYSIWQRPVHLETATGDKERLVLSYGE
ncbi:MAG: SpoVR family protein [Chloroflexota bacterium]